MPTNTSDQQLTMPILADAANNQTAFSAYTAGVESRLVKRYVDLADRTARNPTPTAGEISYLTSAALHFWWNGTAWIELYPIIRRKSANQIVNNSTALVNDLHLILPMQANATYILDGMLYFASVAAADYKTAFTIPVGATSNSLLNAAGGLGIVAFETTIDVGINASVTTVAARGGFGAANFVGNIVGADVITGANAGNLQLQWAQNVADPSNTTCKAGSWLRLTRIPV